MQDQDFQQLQRLIAESVDTRGFLDGMTRLAAVSLSRTTGAPVACTAALRRQRQAVTISGSSHQAAAMSCMEHELGHGPCLEALRTFTTVLLADTGIDRRWPRYSISLAAAGYRSVLAVPLDLDGTASASLNFFGLAPGLFTEEVMGEAVIFTRKAGQALRLALRTLTAERLAADLKTAMESRTTIDIAVGMIMAQNRCTQEEAYQFLLRASTSRDMTIRDVAQETIQRLSGTLRTATFFED